MADEVLDHAPNDLTPAELVVLLALALSARDKDRIARYQVDVATLANRTRRPPGSVRNALSNLTQRGLICPLLTARAGRSQQYEIAKLQHHHRYTTVSHPHDT